MRHADITEGLVLAVDLDGTLLDTDLLHESFWAGMSQAPLLTLSKLWGGGGRAGLKRRLADVSVNVALLPYNQDVLDYIERWRAAGGQVVLATASDHDLAEQIAAHLGVFDAVHASDGLRNLKGANKAALLQELYGETGYAYIGDSAADLPVWQGARRRVTTNAGAALRARVEALGPDVEHLGKAPVLWRAWLRALRPHQWLKNVLVFIPMLAGHAFYGITFLQSLLAFIAFSLVASSVYVLNDLLDLEADRAHPRKRERPLAAGRVPITQITVILPLLLGTGFVLALSLGPLFVCVLLSYYLVTTAYSVHLKRRTIIDIWVLAILYSMRIMAGAAATGIIPSVWLMAFSIFFFFSLAAVKRQAELVDVINRDSPAIRRRGYHSDDVLLIAMMAIASGYVSVLVMALYIRTPFVERLYSYPPVLLGICLILLYWISRIVMVTHRGQMHHDPMVFALRDPVSLSCLAAMMGFAWIATVL